ncbi:hypothetical protein Q7P36_009843 [Cladosporium allicinum]
MATEIPLPPRELDELDRIDSTLVFPTFTSDTAWTLGNLLRARLLPPPPARRNRHHPRAKLPLRLQSNNAQRHHARQRLMGISEARDRPAGDEGAFARKFGMGPEQAGGYAIHGGGWPVRVKGVEGVVAVVVVSGLKQEQDHGVVVQCVAELLEGMGVEVGEKRKED